MKAGTVRRTESAPAVGPVLFDRGVPDCAAYAIYFGIDPSAYLQVSRRHRYEPAALLFEP